MYYALEVDSTMMVALWDLALTQSKAIEKTYNYVVFILNYTSIHPMSVVRYKQSDMIMQVRSNVSYFSVTKACTIAGGYHYLSNDSKVPLYNGPIQNVCEIITNFMTFASEA